MQSPAAQNMKPHNAANDTVFALASAPGRAGVSVVRVSGPLAHQAGRALLGGRLPRARTAALRFVKDPVSHETIDQAVILRFDAPASFTGEDLIEFQLHGSLAVIEAMGEALFGLGLRQALPGEFTRRAFDNERMDLTEAEGLADLIDAETQVQRRQAFRQMDGALKRSYEGWREGILDALAAIEGEIDFPDEEDVPDKLAQRAGAGLDDLIQALCAALEDSNRGERVRHGLDIAIIGAPNVGKSSIINELTRKQAAIVSSEAGTTRDIVEVAMVVAGLPVRVSDTAGLRNTDNQIEAEGVRRALSRAQDADIRIGVIDASDQDGIDRALDELLPRLGDDDIIVLNKSDLGLAKHRNVSRETLTVLTLSANSSQDIDNLRDVLEDIVSRRFSLREDAGLTRARHKDCVERALSAITSARQGLDVAPELAGEDLRAALHAIKELAGETDIEAVLDRIFSRFCIGK